MTSFSLQKTVLVTGAAGFLGRNLTVRLGELQGIHILEFTRAHDDASLQEMVAKADIVFHLAAVNRSEKESDFEEVNGGLTERLCAHIAASGRKTPLVFSSSIHAGADTAYGQSKRRAEEIIEEMASRHDIPVAIYCLPGSFGKWSRPNYNTVVATFCHNIASGLPIRVDNPEAEIELAYVDDIVDEFLKRLESAWQGLEWGTVAPSYKITVGALAEKIKGFHNSRNSLMPGPVGQGLDRALYSTYISFLRPEQFSYGLTMHTDPRGTFVEMLKTQDSGQFSFFTLHPGLTRGSHYHHTKTEKFVIVKGTATLRFRHLITGEKCEISVCSEKPCVIDTIPGWVHDITNTGQEDLVVLIWANEIFDADNPDCIPMKV